MKPREHRQTVQVVARMKSHSGWQDVAIRNVSAHGLRISVALPPRRGSVIEIRRASQIIVARAVWVENGECGLRTQDVVDVPALIDPASHRAESVIRETRSERRATPRIDDTAHRSHRLALRFQQGAIAAVVIAAAGWLAWTVGDVVRAPFERVGVALGGAPVATEDASIARPR